MVPPWGSLEAASQEGAADTHDNAARRVNVPLLERLNHCHVD
jgi:hypothetical protein